MKYFDLDSFTWFLLIVIIFSAIGSFLYVYKTKQSNLLLEKRRRIDQLPSLISTLGVLGTFLGITKGLAEFNSNNLTESIPLLLDGLKTAFYTSLAGMLCSLGLSKYVSTTYDKKDSGVSDINIAAGEIVKAVKSMSEANRETLKDLKDQAVKQANDQAAFYLTVGDILRKIQNASETATSNSNSLVLQAQSQTASISEMNSGLGNMAISLGNLEENSAKQIQLADSNKQIYNEVLSKQKEIANNLGEMVDVISSIATTNDDIDEEVKKFGEKLHAEVIEIEDSMDKTNKLLTAKFDEFTELLKKSNTEALVEVMKRVTEEFQKSMNELINKLIQENFEQLNTSVERLNTWQQENKEMIASLTSQYKEMATNFEGTSTTLTKVGTDTQNLVSDGGKLRQLVDTLSKVIIEDEKFIKISSILTETVNLTKDNMTQFDTATKSLNEWVRKQRNFVDGVQMLIAKLDELNKLRDYNEQFWAGTKRSLEEGIGYISQGSQQLNQQLTQLDAKFYARLSTTLAELDTCIQAMVKNRR